MNTRVCCAFLMTLWAASSAWAASPHGEPGMGAAAASTKHARKHTMGARQSNLRQQALREKLAGKASGRVHQVASGQYVDFPVDTTDRVFVIIAEFGDQIHPNYGGQPGPRHNHIAEPDRAIDNTTIWRPDFNRAHYEQMYFTQMKDYYRAQSSGRYTFSGAVTEWVRVPYNQARYGANYCGDIVCSTTWLLIRDAINIWTADRKAEGWSTAQIQAYLRTFDQKDRYDYNGNGNFDEPDGYIDHFQIVHAGAGEETGGGDYGSDAIWSHRWYAFYNLIGSAGPAGNPLGGLQFGDVGLWVGDYTIQPENGGLGVFAHEYAHDLGLPDQYDGAGGDNATGFWTIMSSGSYLGDGTTDIGARPADFNAWEKFQLGWLTYDVAYYGKHSSHRIGPAETSTKAAQGLFVVLPDKEIALDLGKPTEGQMAWWSGKGDLLNNSMIRAVRVPATNATLTFDTAFDIEEGWDYAYVLVSTDGANWTIVPGNLTTDANPNGQNQGHGLTGNSNGWKAASYDLAKYAGLNVYLAFLYSTDGSVQGTGWLIDRIQLGAFSDGAESGTNGWQIDGFKATSGLEKSAFFNAYVAEYRQYRSYDTGLQTGPYNFGFLNTRPDWVEHYPYQDGLLVSYWDTSMGDNDTSVHPGEGLILPVDAHPQALIRADGRPWSPRVQSYDSTFGLQPTDPIVLHRNGVPSYHPSLPGNPVFDDRNDYWFPGPGIAIWGSVRVPKTGTTIRVVNTSTQGNFSQVHVN